VDQEQRQLQREAQDLELGAEAYLEGARKYPVHSGAGRPLFEVERRRLADALRAWTAQRLGSGRPRRQGFVEALDLDVVSYVTARVAVDEAQRVYAQGQRAPTLQRVALSVGRAVFDLTPAHCLERTENGYRWSRLFNGKQDKPLEWTSEDTQQLGLVLVQMLAAGQLVTIETDGALQNSRARVVLRPETLIYLALENEELSLLHPRNRPMVCAPRRWDDVREGGYLDERLRQPIVRRGGNARTQLVPWTAHSGAQNYLQLTAWRVNARVLDLVPPRDEEAEELRAQLEQGGLTGKERHALQVQLAKCVEHVRIRQAAEGDRHEERLYFVWRPDTRGRLYIDSDALNWLAGGLSRGLLTFARKEKLGPHGRAWLARHVANLAGQDKEPFATREAFVRDHEGAILRAAETGTTEGLDVKEKDRWQFVAAAIEWKDLLEFERAGGKGEDFESALPVTVDGRCNGVQWLSALAGSQKDGELVGLVPADAPRDAYGEVTAFVKQSPALVDNGLSQRLDRQLIKKVMVPLVYGSTVKEQVQHPKGELATILHGWDKEERAALEGAIGEAFATLLPESIRFMETMRDIARAHKKRGREVMQWSSPLQFLVTHPKLILTSDPDKPQVRYTANGKSHKAKFADRWARDAGSYISGFPPNFVHSVDGAHLARVVIEARQRGVHSFAVVHDSFGCHAGNMETLRQVLRGTFAEIAVKARETLELLAAAVDLKLPAVGALDLSRVKESEYLFD
jgi:DNA-directed RNA polymerase, mitochondrial